MIPDAKLATHRVLADVFDERRRQDKKHGKQSLPNGTGLPGSAIRRSRAQALVDSHKVSGELTWLEVLAEEMTEAAAETNPRLLRAELVQVAATAAKWIEDLDAKEAAAQLAAQTPEPSLFAGATE